MDLCRTSLKDVILPKIKSIYVIDYYEGLHSLLESRRDFGYKGFFAKPRIRTQNEITWSTDIFKSHPTRLVELSGETKSYYSYLLCKGLNEIGKLIQQLKDEEGGQPLSELLTKAISSVDESSVFCGEDKVVVVNWGLIPRNAEIGMKVIYRSGKFVGNWDESFQYNPLLRTVTPQPESERTVRDRDISLQPENKPSDGHTSQTYMPPVYENPTQTFAEPEHRMPPHPEMRIGVPDTEIHSPERPEAGQSSRPATGERIPEPRNPLRDDQNIGHDRAPEDRMRREDSLKERQSPMPQRHEPANRSYGWGEFFGGLGKGICFLFKKLWWLLLLILLIILGLFLIRNYQGAINQLNPFFKALPDEPILLPIEEDEVEVSADGMYKIANNRINILLAKKDDKTLDEWAKAFKKAYPSDSYAVKYYNRKLSLLQIVVPKEERAKVMEELKSKLPDFDFDVFEEKIYQSDYVPNDPALRDASASWYIDSIHVKDAWDVTMGSEDIIVAVIDNGFDLDHPELQGKIVKPYNAYERNSNVRPITDKYGIDPHGTHVASTAVGNADNNSGLLGIAPNCKLMPIQVGYDNPEGYMGAMAIVEGVHYAIENGAKVVNMSLGMSPPESMLNISDAEMLNFIDNNFKVDEDMWNDIFEEAAKNDCIIVLSAGNANVIAGYDPRKRNDNTLRVSAVTPQIRKSSFSNYGVYPELDRYYSTVSAPGVAIYNASPGGKYEYLQGTSMAAPIVAGAVALLKSANPSLTAPEIINILQETGHPVESSIGPLIDLGAAMGVARTSQSGSGSGSRDCDKISDEIRKLQARIDSLSRLCPAATAPADTLKYNDVLRDPRSFDGTWKATTRLVETINNTPIEFYMVIENMKGKLLIVESNGDKYTAPLTVNVEGDKINITQRGEAKCPNTDVTYVAYTYKCQPDRKKNLQCNATSSANSLTFNLVRVN